MSKSFTTNAGHLAKRWKRKAEANREGQRAALRETMKQAKWAAETASSGRSYDMRDPKQRAQKPFARSGSRRSLPPHLANIQSGRLRRGWRTRTYQRKDSFSAILFNVAPHSRYFTGRPSRYMIPRPLLEYLMKEARPLLLREAQQELRKAIRK